MFLIADGNEFRFARFYNVYEGVQLVRPESPPIVSGVSDMHPSDCPNVEETRNPMQKSARKKCYIFLQRMFQLHFHLKSKDMIFSLYYLSSQTRGCPLMGQPLVLLHLKVINTADQLICNLTELLCTDVHLLEGIHYLFRLIVRLLRAVHIALRDL